jgi:hypothetical protein
MDETLDPDIEARALALEAAIWFVDKTGGDPQSVSDVTNLAEMFVHYLTHGQANEFNCTDKLRPTVRGGI